MHACWNKCFSFRLVKTVIKKLSFRAITDTIEIGVMLKRPPNFSTLQNHFDQISCTDDWAYSFSYMFCDNGKKIGFAPHPPFPDQVVHINQ